MVERLVLLRTIDSLWVEHLTEIDDMRRGIGLRGYAQQDPLNEFRREAFALYTELRDLIRHQLANTIFRVTVTRQATPPPTAMPMPDEATLSALARRRRCGSAIDRRAGRRSVRPGAVGARRAPARVVRSPAACRPGRASWASANRSATRSSVVAERLRPARCDRAYPGRPADRPQRCLLLRLRPEIQEVPRPVTGDKTDRRRR